MVTSYRSGIYQVGLGVLHEAVAAFLQKGSDPDNASHVSGDSHSDSIGRTLELKTIRLAVCFVDLALVW